MDRIIHLREGQTRPNRVQVEAGELIKLALASPEGWTFADAEAKWGWDRNFYFSVVREAREQLGHEDEFNIVCEPQGAGELYRYRLVGTHAEASEWLFNRVKDMTARARTHHNVILAVTRKLDGRTTAGRHAKAALKQSERFVEDMSDWLAEIAPRG